jgi:two-component system chemotaxis response regulator CheY
MHSCLLVDHSTLVRKLERRIMEELGFRIVEAENGRQAIERCQAQMPSLVLLDWHMPVMNGLDCLKTLRAMTGGSAPKVMFCTTESVVASITKALDAGADEYVMKPFDAEIIRGKLQQLGMI